MNLSDNVFSAAEYHTNMFVTGPLEMEETGFNPKYEQAGQTQKRGAKDVDLEHDPTPVSDALDEKMADAYAHGYVNGQQAALAASDEQQESQDRLAAAINQLRMVDDGQLSKQLFETVLLLFHQAVGDAKVSKQLMQERCDAVVEMINADVDEACLYVAPSDAKTLQHYKGSFSLEADPELSPGSVRLAYGSGQIISGTAAVAEEIKTRASVAGGVGC